METKNMTQEQISALVDNELSDEQVNLALAALRQADGRDAWDIYHQIGDVLRSDEMAHDFSPDFTARLMARLDAEPTVMAPQPKQVAEQPSLVAVGGGRSMSVAFRRFGAPTAMAAVAVIALIASPQLLVGLKGDSAKDSSSTQMVASAGLDQRGSLQNVAAQDITVSAATQNGVLLRDPKIDEYLLAHQRFSPAWNSSAQYARSATFASGTAK
jgi:sigma-E factor negative regulatory protein RseA